jgi:oligoendopeptidase F
MEEHSNMAKGVVWNLGELYLDDEDPKLAQDLKAAQDKARGFVSAHKDKLNDKDLDVSKLLSAIQEYESIHEMAMNPFLFAYLNHSFNTQDHTRNRLFQKVREKWNEISQRLSFFFLHITALPEGLLKELINNDDLSYYRHFLLKLIQRKTHDLSEPEEWIIQSKDLAGRKAFASLYDELIGSLSFTLEIEGKNRQFNTNQALTVLHSPDRSLREKVFRTFSEELGRHGMIFKHILNTLILDYHQENVARGHPSPMHRRHLSNEVDETIIEAMMGSVEDHYALAKRYFRLKGRLRKSCLAPWKTFILCFIQRPMIFLRKIG